MEISNTREMAFSESIPGMPRLDSNLLTAVRET